MPVGAGRGQRPTLGVCGTARARLLGAVERRQQMGTRASPLCGSTF